MNGTVMRISAKPKKRNEVGLPKPQVDSVMVTAAGVEGDYNTYRQETLDGDPDQAVLLMPLETLAQLRSEGWNVGEGDLGENFTTYGIPYDSFEPEQRYRIGRAEIVISKQAEPCKNLHTLSYVGAEKGPAFCTTLKGRRGWYARVVKDGTVCKGDSIEQLV